MMFKTPINRQQIDNLCLGDKQAGVILRELVLRAKSVEGIATRPDGSTILLKRGECICGRRELAKLFMSSQMKIRGKLDFIEKVAKQITKRRGQQCSIVNIINYDDIVILTKSITNRQPNDNQMDNHKVREYIRENNISNNKDNSVFIKYNDIYKEFNKNKDII